MISKAIANFGIILICYLNIHYMIDSSPVNQCYYNASQAEKLGVTGKAADKQKCLAWLLVVMPAGIVKALIFDRD